MTGAEHLGSEPLGAEPGALQQNSGGAGNGLGSGEGLRSHLLVAGDRQLQLMAADGTVVAEVAVDFRSAAVAIVPSPEGGFHEVVVLATDGGLHRVSLPALTVRPLGQPLDPQNACLTGSPASWLLGFSTLPSSNALCVELARDEWESGRTYAQVRVTLADGSQVATTTLDVGPTEGGPTSEDPF
jgi:hypothetical protein